MGVDIWRMVRCVISEMCDFCISSIAPFLIYICPLYLDFFISFFENFLPKIYICLLYLDFFIPFCTWIFLCRFFIPFVPGFSNSIFHVICTYTLPSTHVHTTMYHTHILYTWCDSFSLHLFYSDSNIFHVVNVNDPFISFFLSVVFNYTLLPSCRKWYVLPHIPMTTHYCTTLLTSHHPLRCVICNIWVS